MADQSLEYYIDRYLRGVLTPEESAVLRRLLDDPAQSSTLHSLMDAQLSEWEKSDMAFPEVTERLQRALAEQITEQPQPAAPVRHLSVRWRWVWAAASIGLVLGIGAYIRTINKKAAPARVSESQQLKADVQPGGNKAVLTLADGTTIVLDNAANGSLAQQGSAEVVKLGNGQIVYHRKGSAGKEVLWNTMRTPPGGAYQVVLPDGTKVWLNAASAITYPTAFVANTREVKIKGEAYFEAAKNKQQPFMVDIDGKSRVEVLGTSFNINSYENEEDVRTTLFDGSIRVIRDDKSVLLKPGQQAVVAVVGGQSKNSVPIAVRMDADTDQVLAWKNGYFDFNGLNLQAIMRQLERWYDIKVKYQDSVSDGIYGGKMSRSVNLSDVLYILQKVGGIQFRLEGKTLTIL